MKEIKIEIPDGHVIDPDNSNLKNGIIKFMKDPDILATYNKIANYMFKTSKCYFIDNDLIKPIKEVEGLMSEYDGNEALTSEQLESILALNKLINVALYLNGAFWIPRVRGMKWFVGLSANSTGAAYRDLTIGKHESVKYSCVYFKSRQLAERAIEILGEDVVKKALTLQF